MWVAQFGDAEIGHSGDRKFSTRAEIVPVGDAQVFHYQTTADYWARSRRQVASDRREGFIIGFSRSRTGQVFRHGSNETTLRRGSVMVHTVDMPSETRTGGDVAWTAAMVPTSRIIELVPDAESRIATLLDPGAHAVRHLEHYLDFLLKTDGVAGEPTLSENAQGLLLDLMVLALGSKGEAAEMAAARGLRAVRLREVLTTMERYFADPAFSSDTVARSVGISRRYVNDLLAETGTGFTERVMELRLQKARTMLASAAHNRLKISDIALDCGFGEVSYFNRCFRARFGCSPTQFRQG